MTPIVVDGVMYISTPLGKAIAIEPATGREIWRYEFGTGDAIVAFALQ